MVKGVGSERSYEMLTLSLQTLGGSGFLQDYPIEQYIRDAKIDSLYEGTTGIQSLDLFFRKIIRDQGQAFGALLAKVREFAAADGGNGRLKAERAALADAAAQVEGIATAMTGYLMASAEQPAEIYKAGLNTTRLLMALGDLVIGWLLLTHAEIALRELDELDAGAPDHDFYAGKLAAARFFAATVLPRLAAERKVAEETTLDLMDLPGGRLLTLPSAQFQASIRTGSSSIAPTSRSTAEPSSPSMMRWSKDSDKVHTERTASCPSTTHGASLTWPKARMAASPGVRIGVPPSTPNTPTLVIVIVPPARSAGVALPARAVSARACRLRASSGRDSSPAFLTFGTSRPRSAATAMPRFT